MTRFIPLPMGWTVHPLCRKLRCEDPSYPDRWIHLVDQAHQVGASGKLFHFDGESMEAEDLAHSHDHDTEGWASFLEFCFSLNLADRSEDGTLKVSQLVWKQWYRPPSDDPEREKYRKRADRKEKEAKELQDELERLKAHLAEDALPPVSESVRSCPDLSGAVPDVRTSPDHQIKNKTDRSISISKNKSDLSQNTDLSECTQHKNGSDQESLAELFWEKVPALFKKFVRKKWKKADRVKLEECLTEPWAQTYSRPKVWLWTLHFALEEMSRQRDERAGTKNAIKHPWPFALAICDQYAEYANRLIQNGRKQEFIRVERLSDL